MDIGIPVEQRPDENRVALTPDGVRELTRAGHRVYVECGAGDGSGFPDRQYTDGGAQLVYSTAEAWGRGQLILKVGRPLPWEVEMLTAGQVLCGFLHLAAGKRRKVEAIVQAGATALAWEMVQPGPDFSVLELMSELAGRMAVQIAARLLENQAGGKGILLSGIAGVPPAEVVVLGGGVLGRAAAQGFVAAGANVYVLDQDLGHLHRVEHETGSRAVTMMVSGANLRKVLGFADVVIGAIRVPGQRTPILVSREMMATMRPRSVVIDFSIDEGGCFETSRPTRLHSPTYVEEGIIHWCVPNTTGAVGRTASHTFTNVTLPYVRALAGDGLTAALSRFPELASGVVIRNGRILSAHLLAREAPTEPGNPAREEGS